MIYVDDDMFLLILGKQIAMMWWTVVILCAMLVKVVFMFNLCAYGLIVLWASLRIQGEKVKHHTDGLVQERRSSIINALESFLH